MLGGDGGGQAEEPRLPSPLPPPHGLGVCIWMHLVNGTGNSPSPGRPTPGVVKHDKSSGGSVDTTKTRSDPQRVRMSSGERPIGTAKGKQPDTEALCPTPPPLVAVSRGRIPSHAMRFPSHGFQIFPWDPSGLIANGFISITFPYEMRINPDLTAITLQIDCLGIRPRTRRAASVRCGRGLWLQGPCVVVPGKFGRRGVLTAERPVSVPSSAPFLPNTTLMLCPCPAWAWGKLACGGVGGEGSFEKAATRRNMRREERVTVQGPVKEQQPDGMSHGGGGGHSSPPKEGGGVWVRGSRDRPLPRG